MLNVLTDAESYHENRASSIYFLPGESCGATIRVKPRVRLCEPWVTVL